MLALSIEIELTPSAGDATAIVSRVRRDLRDALGLSVPVQVVAPGALPRFEMKARRFVIQNE
jgi:phenylacetate-CoA ligase